MVRQAHHDKKKGFTLLELLLVIAIISSLAGIILMALNPAQRLEEANETKYLANARDLKKAIEAYAIENGGNLPTSFNSLSYGYYDICKEGESTNCINIDELLPNYLPTIPEDTENSTTEKSGFRVKYDPDSTSIDIYVGDDYTQRIESGTTFTEGLVGYWKMDETVQNTCTDGVTDSCDSSGSGFDGQWGGNATSIASLYGNGVIFDGSDDYVLSSNKVDLTGDQTYSIWVNPSVVSSNLTGIFSTHNHSTTSNFGLNLYTNIRVSIGYQDGTREYAGKGTTYNLTTGQWTFVTLVYKLNSNRVEIYINGQFDTGWNLIKPVKFTPEKILFGQWAASSLNNYEFSGLLDEARLYNRALNADEIAALYDYGAPPIAYWKFSGNLNDETGTYNLNASLSASVPQYTPDRNGNLTSALNLMQEEYGSTLTYVNATTLRDSSKSWTTNEWTNYNLATNHVTNFCQAIVASNTTTDLVLNSSCGSWTGNKQFILKKNLYIYKNVNYGANAISAMGWIKTDSSQFYPFHTLFRASGDDFAIEFSNTSMSGHIDGYASGFNCPINVMDNVWHHLALTWDGTTAALYFDGTQCATQLRTTTMSNNETVRIGVRSDGWSHFLEGILDDVKIYNYARTQEQIVKDMNNL